MKLLITNSSQATPLLIALLLSLSIPTANANTTDETVNIGKIELEKIDVNAQADMADMTTPAQEIAEGSADLPINDPWEDYNRSIYSFNKKADKYVIRPIAVAYDKVTPEPVQQGVRNFFSNWKSPTTLINELLQGRPLDSAKTLSRFSVNTTVGILGIFDPASAIGLERRSEDFGQTLAVWGWENSNYLVMPLLGPLTMRDVVGFIGDTPTNPMNYADGGTNAALQSVEITDMRKQMLPMDDLMASAIDEYAMMRDAWSAGRAKEIQEGTQTQTTAGTSLLQSIFQ